MLRDMRVTLFLAAIAVLLSAGQQKAATSIPDLPELQAMQARFAPTPLEVDVSGLSAGDRQALIKLIQASRIVNHIFMEQFWSGDLALYQKLQQDDSPLGRARLHYFWLNKGPWSEVDEHTAFIPGVPARKPLGSNFYPEDMTKDEFETWVKTLSPCGKGSGRGILHRHPPRPGP